MSNYKITRTGTYTLDTVNIEESDNAVLINMSKKHVSILMAARTQSYKEIAAGARISVGTVRSRLHRAREALVRLRAGGHVKVSGTFGQ